MLSGRGVLLRHLKFATGCFLLFIILSSCLSGLQDNSVSQSLYAQQMGQSGESQPDTLKEGGDDQPVVLPGHDQVLTVGEIAKTLASKFGLSYESDSINIKESQVQYSDLLTKIVFSIYDVLEPEKQNEIAQYIKQERESRNMAPITLIFYKTLKWGVNDFGNRYREKTEKIHEYVFD